MKSSDLIVIGGGAAGLMAAIAAAEAGAPSVLLLEANVRAGTKILMSGGTRCNVTNDVVNEGHFNTDGSIHIIRRILKAFTADETIAFFRRLQVELTIEPGTGKLFPATDDARTVLHALLTRLTEVGIRLETRAKIVDIRTEPGGTWRLEALDGRIYGARAVIVATGGRSYPTTGSDGTGYGLLKQLGHGLVRLSPALTPLVLSGMLPKDLQGVTLPAALSLFRGEKRLITFEGSTLVTHFGLSGPPALNISRHWMRLHRAVEVGEAPIQLKANWLPGLGTDPQSLEKAVVAESRMHPDRTVGGFLARILPNRFAAAMVNDGAIDGTIRLGQLSKEVRRTLCTVLAAWPVPVIDTRGYSKAEVTAGGIPLGEVDPSTMASRCTPGLFLCGEVLDVDGWLGGYNFQWAWSSGHVAGRAAAQYLARISHNLERIDA